MTGYRKCVVPREPVGRDGVTDSGADAHDTNRIAAIVLCLIDVITTSASLRPE